MPIDVSVIVPVYNTEKYLNQCVDSLLNQTLKNVEFIFVDDGSTDRSVEIIEEYQRKDDRIRLIKQKNQYAGVARNNGMKVATGKYIIFLDSDDFFEPTLLEDSYTRAESTGAEIVYFGYNTYNDKTGEIVNYKLRKTEQDVFSPDVLGDRLFCTFLEVPWNKLYLKTFLDNNDAHFQEIRKHNDVCFAQLTVAIAHKIATLDELLVYYRIGNEQSLQGENNSTLSFFLESLDALKKELMAREKYEGAVCLSYRKFAVNAIEYRSKEYSDYSSLAFYETAKQRILPMLDDSEEAVQNRLNLESVYLCDSYEAYVQRLLQKKDEEIKNLREETISKKSKDYRIGHFLLIIPRFIKRMTEKMKGE